MKARSILAALAMFALVMAAPCASAVTLSGTVSGENSVAFNFTCDGTPTCTGTYTVSFVDPQCGAMPAFSGPVTFSNFDPSQPTSSGTVSISGFRSFAGSGCGIAIFSSTGPYSATSNGSSGSISLTITADAAPKTLAGSFVTVGAASPVRVSGKYGLGDSSGYMFGSFTCTGMPTCSGSVAFSELDHGCSNTFSWTVNAIFTGLDLTHAGPLSGTVTVYGSERSNVVSGTTCSYGLRDTNAHVYNYSGTWDGAAGKLAVTFVDEQNQSFQLPGTFSASGTGVSVTSPPVFPMTVASSVTPATASASATVQARTQDAGKSLFVFGHAPSNLVSGAHPAKRDPGDHAPAAVSDDSIVCVLAQVNSSGQLVSVSASTMQAYATNVLSSQSQAVQILNNVPTSNVAGTTMYVGYGASAQDMLASGVFQTAISVPGGVQCTASLASAPAPETPGPLTGLWWNPSESGWGMHIAQRSNVVVVTWYTYDAAGNPKWYIASNCAGPSGASGSCTGAVYEVNGPTFFGADFHPITGSQVSQAGTLTLNFSDANNATLNFTVAGVTRTVAITRQIFPVTPTAPPAVDYTDLWWNPNEAGWGMAITHQYGDIFLAWYVYDATGKPMWYVASNCTVSGSSCSGALYRTTSAPFGPTYDTSQFKVFTAGSAIVSFIDANNAVLSYTVDNVTATKTITRQIFP